MRGNGRKEAVMDVMLPGRHKNSNHSRVFAAASPLCPLIYRWLWGKRERDDGLSATPTDA